MRRGRGRAGPARGADHARRAPGARSAPRRRGFLYTVSVTGTTGERKDLAAGLAALLARAKAAPTVPVALGFGIATPEQAAAAADAGADGVIVGSRLVAAGRRGAADPAAAVGALVRGLAAGLGIDSRLRMGLVLATAAGLVVWIILWAIGVKAFDAFLITLVIVLAGPGGAGADAPYAGPVAKVESAIYTLRRSLQPSE